MGRDVTTLTDIRGPGWMAELVRSVEQYVSLPEAVWMTYGVVLLLAVFASIVLGYHWYKYGRGRRGVRTGVIIYAGGVVVLLSVATISLLAWSI